MYSITKDYLEVSSRIEELYEHDGLIDKYDEFSISIGEGNISGSINTYRHPDDTKLSITDKVIFIMSRKESISNVDLKEFDQCKIQYELISESHSSEFNNYSLDFDVVSTKVNGENIEGRISIVVPDSEIDIPDVGTYWSFKLMTDK